MRIGLTRAGFAVLIIVVLLAACAGSGQMLRERQQTLDHWEALVRWNQFDALIDLIHPEWLAENPVPALDLERLRQFRVTQYRVRHLTSDPDDLSLERTVEIRLYHVHSARERVINHREVWRFDAELDRWLMHSGLPDPRQS